MRQSLYCKAITLHAWSGDILSVVIAFAVLSPLTDLCLNPGFECTRAYKYTDALQVQV